jgi:hypothetical protein
MLTSTSLISCSPHPLAVVARRFTPGVCNCIAAASRPSQTVRLP